VNEITQKLDYVIGLFHDGGIGSFFLSNIAAGSERSGYTGPAVACAAADAADPTTAAAIAAAAGGTAAVFDGNEVYSSLAGFWFNPYRAVEANASCIALEGLTAWKIWHYGVYGEVLTGDGRRIEVRRLAVADSRVGVRIAMGNGGVTSTGEMDPNPRDDAPGGRVISVENSLVVARSGNANCFNKAPSLWTCTHEYIYCDHRHPGVRLVVCKDSV
jgi:hypothetical protein